MKYMVYFEKNDKWNELGIFEGNTKKEIENIARNSDILLNYYSKEEIEYVNLEVEALGSD